MFRQPTSGQWILILDCSELRSLLRYCHAVRNVVMMCSSTCGRVPQAETVLAATRLHTSARLACSLRPRNFGACCEVMSILSSLPGHVQDHAGGPTVGMWPPALASWLFLVAFWLGSCDSLSESLTAPSQLRLDILHRDVRGPGWTCSASKPPGAQAIPQHDGRQNFPKNTSSCCFPKLVMRTFRLAVFGC